MYRVILLISIALITTMLVVVPSMAANGPLTEQEQQSQQHRQTPPGSSYGGIQPVSPEQFTQKVDGMIDRAYRAASPVTDAVAKIMLAVTGVAALLILFTGIKAFYKIFVAVLSIGFGILLFYGAPHIVGLIKGLAQATK